MSKCIFKEIANNLDKEEFEVYYKTHTVKEVCDYFDFDFRYFYRIAKYLNIELSSKERYCYINKTYCRTPEAIAKGSQSSKGRKFSSETIEKIRKANIGKHNHSKNKTTFTKGSIPWNKGKKGVQKWTDNQKDKYYNTLKQINWYTHSKAEENLYLELCNIYDKSNIERQYSEERYPFRCDFYIKSEDLFIELNRNWTHGGRPYDPEDKECQEKLAIWQEKAKTSKFYENAIYTWTDLDLRKQQIAEQNNLNYKLIY